MILVPSILHALVWCGHNRNMLGELLSYFKLIFYNDTSALLYLFHCRSAGPILGPTSIALLQKMPWDLSFFHITICTT